MPLTQADPHHWQPVADVLRFIESRIPPEARVLDVGPGHAPFKRADAFVDFAPGPIEGVPVEKLHKCDLAHEPLPFPDKSFEFVFCRHVLEDMFNPFPLLREMERVGKAGYIETPSPIAELTRGVDGSAPPYRGYHHHRFVCWSNGSGLRFVSKYPLVEYIDIDDRPYAAMLRQGPKYWNTYHLWTDRIFHGHVQSPLDFDVGRQYRTVLVQAAAQSIAATDAFWKTMTAAVIA